MTKRPMLEYNFVLGTFCPRYLSSGSLKHMPLSCCLTLPILPVLILIFSMGTFFSTSFSANGISDGVNIINAFPPRSNRAVRPTRWIYVSTSSGQSSCITQSTSGKSRPRAAMSVHSKYAWLADEKRCVMDARRLCFCLPWRCNSDTPGCKCRNVSYVNRTCVSVIISEILVYTRT